MAFNANFNPMSVSLPRPGAIGGGGNPTGAYMPISNQRPAAVGGGGNPTASKFTNPGQTMAAGAVRATGAGPYDPAFRQNLATYAGGQFARPGGSLSFNPTGTNTSWANNSLLGQALGGQAYVPNVPTPAKPATQPKKSATTGGMQIPGITDNWQGYGLGINLGGR